MDVQFLRAVPEDADRLIAVQDQSFYADYVKYGVCPGYRRTRESMLESISRRIVYKIQCDGNIVGDIIVRDEGGGAYYLGCLCVIPTYENRGIGQLALAFLDQHFPDAAHWALETPADKERNHYFYQKHGYRVTKEYPVDGVLISYFEKSC
ncbi:MAG TPA: GNAT family N-acetyltransferase [Candidatus Limiplasma sp.]|nr:GNAT family N-acetyltransferase [Candidatus Limiplasma sp.]